MHDILMITYNRASYTRQALSRLLDSCDDSMRVWVWHNGDHQPTLDVVKDLSSHRNFHHLEVSEENVRLTKPTNWFWRNSDGEYLSKIDDDCLEPDGWGETLRLMHEKNPKLGIIGTWRFYEEDFVPDLAKRKVRDLNGGFQLMSNPWVQGSGYVMKRACLEQNGFLNDGLSFPAYCIQAALKNWENGWAFPFIHEEHMDDPRSPYCEIKTDEEFLAQRPLSAIRDNVTSLDQWAERVKHMSYLVQKAHPDPRRYVGWRKSLSNLSRRVGRVLGRGEDWRRAGRS